MKIFFKILLTIIIIINLVIVVKFACYCIKTYNDNLNEALNEYDTFLESLENKVVVDYKQEYMDYYKNKENN